MRKRVLAILLAVAFIIVLTAACGDTGTVERQPGDSARAMLVTKSDAPHLFAWNEFQRLMGEYNIEMVQVTSNNEAAIEVAGIERAINEGFNIIFCNPTDVEAVIEPLKRARAAGIIVGMFSSQLPEGEEDAMDFVCRSDDFLGSMMAGQLVSEIFSGGASFVEIGGPAGTAQIMRSDGFRVGLLEGAGDNIIELDSKNAPGWESYEAKIIMEEFLAKHGNAINIVWCHWDVGVTGVIEAVNEAGRSDIYIIGFDGNAIGYRQVRDGLQALSVGNSITNVVKQSLENARKLLDGTTVPTINIVPMDLITIDNVNEKPWPEW